MCVWFISYLKISAKTCLNTSANVVYSYSEVTNWSAFLGYGYAKRKNPKITATRVKVLEIYKQARI